CNQCSVHTSAQVEVDRVVAQPHDQVGLPGAAVRRRVDVDPEQRCDRGQQQHAVSARLGTYELTKWRLKVARPGGLAGERPGAVGRVAGHAALCPDRSGDAGRRLSSRVSAGESRWVGGWWKGT